MNKNPSRAFHFSLLFLVGFNLLIHIQGYAGPVLITGGLAILWRILYEFQKVPLPPFWMRWIFVGMSFYWAYTNYGQIWGLEAGTALLIIAMSLKLIERAQYHDSMVVLFLNFMILLVRVLEDQSLWMTFIGAIDLVAVTALLIQLHASETLKFDAKSLLWTGLKLTLQASPLLFLLFFVFPRFTTQFGFIPTSERSRSGFRSELDPGMVSGVAQSEQIAFRVQFPKDNAPATNELYWRGAVLGQTFGMSWKPLNTLKKTSPVLNKKNVGFQQEILLEPRFKEWIFGLESINSIAIGTLNLRRNLRYSSENYYKLRRPATQKLLYNVYSTNEAPPQKENLELYKKHPEEKDARVLQFIKEIKEKTNDTEKRAFHVLSYFRKNFRYSLFPERMKTRNVSEFMFEKKVGFCEHFAASFSYLMRLMDIPSRVVIGFQGGRVNKLSDYLIVKDRDAHAWSEIWIADQKRWKRIDPTQFIEPLRTELGGDLFLGLTEDQLQQRRAGEDYITDYESSWAYRIFGQSQLALDLLSTRWNYFLLSYDKTGQRDFFKEFGFEEINPLVLSFISGLILFLFIIFLRRSQKSKRKKGEAEKIYDAFCLVFEDKGLKRSSSEAPEAYIKRCQQNFSDLTEPLDIFKNIYLPWRYSSQRINLNDQQKLKELLQKFKNHPSKV